MNPYAPSQTQATPQTAPPAPTAAVTQSILPKEEKVESVPEPQRKQMLTDR